MMSTFLMIFSLGIWAALHSWTASVPFKKFIEQKFGKRFLLKYYRLIYNIFALVSIVPAAVVYLTAPQQQLYNLDGVFGVLARIFQANGIMLMVLAVNQTGTLRFAGFRAQFDIETGEVDDFISEGVYGWVRHPIYTGTYLLFFFDPVMTDLKLLVYVILSIYILIGISFEERRLVWEFGDRYRTYRSEVPMLIPIKLRKKI